MDGNSWLLDVDILYHSDQLGGGVVDDKKNWVGDSGGGSDDDDNQARTVAPTTMTANFHASTFSPNATSSTRARWIIFQTSRSHRDNETFVESLLLVGEVVVWTADGAPWKVEDSSDDGDEGFDGFGCGSSRPEHTLRPFDARFATSSWTRWDSTT